MLPTNSGRAKDQGCNPVSSNCVVWQGPDLGCIGLCKGDTISDVIEKLATELCTLVDMFDLSEFDFSCLAVPISETPADTGELIQILIDRICALENINPGTPGDPSATDCPDNCIVPIADCFYFIDPQGDTVTTMTLTDYVNTIGNRICDILNDITALQDAVATLQQQQLDTATDITNIQNDYATTASLQYQVNIKTSPDGVQYVTDALRDIENSLIRTQDGVGSETELYQNIIKEGNIGDEARTFGIGLMNGYTGWTNTVVNAAESIGNLWLTVQDLRDQVKYISENCCSSGCTDIFLNFRVSLAGSIITFFTDGSTGFTGDWAECTGTSKVTITDELGNATTITTSLLAIIDEPLGYSFDLTPTPVDFSLNLNVVADTCFINTATDTTCNQDYTDTVVNSPSCPTVILTAYATSINYQFTSLVGYSYILNIYYSGGSVPVASQIITSPGAIVVGSILGLLTETDYQFEAVVVDTTGGETVCPSQAFTTLPSDCQPPINVVAILTI